MKKWYLWLVLALVFAISGIMNYIDDRSVLAQVIQVSIAFFSFFIANQLYESKENCNTYLNNLC